MDPLEAGEEGAIGSAQLLVIAFDALQCMYFHCMYFHCMYFHKHNRLQAWADTSLNLPLAVALPSLMQLGQ